MDNEGIELLREAIELFGDEWFDASIESDEWIWRGRVRYYLEDIRLTPVAADAVLAPAGDGDGDTHRAAEHDG